MGIELGPAWQGKWTSKLQTLEEFILPIWVPLFFPTSYLPPLLHFRPPSLGSFLSNELDTSRSFSFRAFAFAVPRLQCLACRSSMAAIIRQASAPTPPPKETVRVLPSWTHNQPLTAS